MQVTQNPSSLRLYPRPVVAIGMFDGVHRGHRFILRAAIRRARAVRGTSAVLTFWPHPRQKDSLYSLEHRLRTFDQLGIDVCVVVSFTRRFRNLLPEEFVQRFLVKKIGAFSVVVGENFRFGRAMQADSLTLSRLTKRYGISTHIIGLRRYKGRVVSSTAIRELISGGDLRTAAHLLARPVSILGTVVGGSSVGRTWGVPTANVLPDHEVLPARGVYAAWAIIDGRRYPGACYIGAAPPFVARRKAKTARPITVEVHIFGFSRDIYGKKIEVQFIKKIRDEMRFTSAPSLVFQIKKDIKEIKKIFSHH